MIPDAARRRLKFSFPESADVSTMGRIQVMR